MAGLILIVEDEADLARTLEYNLQSEGYRTRLASTARSALDQAAQEPHPSLVLLDLMLPDMSGVEVCRSLRLDPSTRDIPVIMVTAKGDEIDRVVGFEVGADDYVVKPFSVRELLLRIKAVLRRREVSSEQPPSVLELGSVRVDPEGHQVWVDGREVALTALEFRLLKTLMTRRGRAQSRETLLADVWGVLTDVNTRTVDTHIKRLREKLGRAGSYIETLRGVGYRFVYQPDGGTE